ncbi:MAG: NAD-dependent epimerase/dehydratase family protein [Chitinophagaceae bacterium]
MNVCVIGGSGFIGSHLINSIATQHTVTNVDKQLPIHA